MGNILVSIVCITYNHASYIRKTLDSFLAQKTSFDYEIIIHDDASTDGTTDIIEEYVQKYPEIIIPIFQTENQYSKGIPITSNVVIRHTRGKYIAFCEGDDFWIDENKLEKQVQFLECNLEYIACVHRYIVVDEHDTEIDLVTFGYYEKCGRYTLSDFKSVELPSQLASLVFRNVVENNEKFLLKRLFDNTCIQGDMKWFLYLLRLGDIYRMEDVMSAYRFVEKLGSNSYTSRQLGRKLGWKKFKDLCVLEKVYNELFKYDLDLKIRKRLMGTEVVIDFLKQPSCKGLGRVLYVCFTNNVDYLNLTKRILKKILPSCNIKIGLKHEI